jgi:hypothetical protein
MPIGARRSCPANAPERRSTLRGSTLDTHRTLLDPGVRRRGVTVDFAKLDASG